MLFLDVAVSAATVPTVLRAECFVLSVTVLN